MSEITQNPNYCCICLRVQNHVKTHCQSGIMCVECIEKYNKEECPICREETYIFIPDNDINNEIIRQNNNSSIFILFNIINFIVEFTLKILSPLLLLSAKFYLINIFGFTIINLLNMNPDNFGIFGIWSIGMIPYLLQTIIYNNTYRPPALLLIAQNRRPYRGPNHIRRRILAGYYRYPDRIYHYYNN